LLVEDFSHPHTQERETAMRGIYRALRRAGMFLLMAIITILIIIEPVPRFFMWFLREFGTLLRLYRLRPWFERRPLWFAVLVVGFSGSIFGICEVAQYPILALGFPLTALFVHLMKWTAFPITRYFFRMYKRILLPVRWIRRSYKHGRIAHMRLMWWLNTKEWYMRPVAFKEAVKKWTQEQKNDLKRRLREKLAFVRLRLAANKQRRVIKTIETAIRLRRLRVQKGECI
jgi:hypothetical protein